MPRLLNWQRAYPVSMISKIKTRLSRFGHLPQEKILKINSWGSSAATTFQLKYYCAEDFAERSGAKSVAQ